MDFNLLRSWLGLPPGPWPPDHYALLGLDPGRADPAAVEPRVMERMDLLRRRQLMHPDLVTEGMNRLAQALITLTDPAEKTAYDAQLGVPVADTGGLRPPLGQMPPPAAAPGPAVVAEPPLEILFTEDSRPPARTGAAEVTQEVVEAVLVSPPPRYDFAPAEKPPPLPLPEDVPAPEAVALPGPAGRRWVYARLALLRKSLRAWDRLGPVLGDPQDPVDRPGRVLLLLEAAGAVRELLPELRGFVGGVGGPGGVVAAVVTQPLLLDTFRRLLPDQRQALAIDWRRGQTELQREYARMRRLAREGRAQRTRTTGGLVLLRWVKEVPEIALVVLAAFALAVALLRSAGTR